MVNGVDHGFLATPPAGPAREGMTAIAAHLSAAYAVRADLPTTTKETP